jgi:protein SCO1
MRSFFLVIIGAIVLTACGGREKASVSAEAKRYPLKGKVVSVDRAAKKAKIDHEAIPDFMPAMTMDFPIHEDWVWDELQPGAEVHAELVVDNTAREPYWLEKIGIVAAPRPGQEPPPVNENFVQIGKDVPDFRLTDQDGKRFSLRDYRGKALALTFIYRECPLPEYCIKMSKNFSDLALKLGAEPDAREKIRLLSISFDPERDTPAKLRQYGLGYMGNGPQADFKIWRLAVGSDKDVKEIADFFGLRYEVDQMDRTQINHSLITAVIAPDGRVTKIFPGNEWTTDDLLRELRAAYGS